jgi:hypothetical protein
MPRKYDLRPSACAARLGSAADWKTLPAGTLVPARGAGTLTIKALSKPGATVMDLKRVWLRRSD